MSIKKLKQHWRTSLAETRRAGDAWLLSARSLLLEVPSVLVPERKNFLINPLHPEMKKLRITARYSDAFDTRFFR